MCAAFPRYCRCKSDITSDIARRGCIFLPICSGQPISLPDFTRPLPGSVFTKKLVNVSDSRVSRYEGTVGWYPYADRKFRINRSLSGKRHFPLTLFITRASLAKNKRCKHAERFTLKFHVLNIYFQVSVEVFSLVSSGKLKLFRKVAEISFFASCLVMEIRMETISMVSRHFIR